MTQPVQFRNDGLLIYEPWYSRVMQVLDYVEKLTLPTISIGGDSFSLEEVFGRVIAELDGFEISVPVLGLAMLLALKLTGRIYRGVVAEAEPVSVTVSTSTAFVEAE